MEKRIMLLTRKMLNKILRNHRFQIPAELKKELLATYSNAFVTEDGLTLEYSEQDICEQLRKIIRPYQESGDLPEDVAKAFSELKQ
jgi:hypothetical protein